MHMFSGTFIKLVEILMEIFYGFSVSRLNVPCSVFLSKCILSFHCLFATFSDFSICNTSLPAIFTTCWIASVKMTGLWFSGSLQNQGVVGASLHKHCSR